MKTEYNVSFKISHFSKFGLEAFALLTGMLEFDPSIRLSAFQCIRSTFISGNSLYVSPFYEAEKEITVKKLNSIDAVKS